MIQFPLDDAFANRLLKFTEPVELCDPSGRVLGRFTPTGAGKPSGPPEPKLSEEELLRREQEPEYTTAEVLAYLEKL